MAVKSSRAETAREAVPFRVIDHAGRATELTYVSPRAAAEHDEAGVLEQLPWFEAGQPRTRVAAFYDGRVAGRKVDYPWTWPFV